LPEVAPGRPAKPYLGSEGIFLSACAKHPEAAFQVMRFLASDEAALRRYLEGRQLVANRRVWETLEGTGRWDPVLGVFRAQAEAAVVMPSSAKMQPVWSTADNALKRAIFGGGDIGEALQGAQEKAVHDIAAMGK
ncbi:MAG: hypothetical protein FJ098_05015, partial [Deltaproteobacteria bacterium]|nr:hypothetical protein [Deltaproteobacteria bacterium]